MPQSQCGQASVGDTNATYATLDLPCIFLLISYIHTYTRFRHARHADPLSLESLACLCDHSDSVSLEYVIRNIIPLMFSVFSTQCQFSKS